MALEERTLKMAWFRFPPNVSSISVERQDFKPEFTNDNGDKFFRAPAHFAPAILDMSLGFSQIVPGPDWPDDLPPEEISNAVDNLSATVSNLQSENLNLRAMLNETVRERDQLKIQNEDFIKQINELRESAPKNLDEKPTKK